MKKIIFLILFVLTFSLPVASLLADEDNEIKQHPGYVNLDEIEIPDDAEETVEVYVNSPLLKLISKATEDEDPEMAELQLKLLMVRVNTFSIDRDLAGDLKTKINKSDEAVFVNIVGEIDWRSIHKIGRHFDIDELKNFDENEPPQDKQSFQKYFNHRNRHSRLRNRQTQN